MVRTGIPDAVQAEEDAFKSSLRTSVQEQTNFLLEHVGPRVTAAALGLADARPLNAWRTGDVGGPKSASVVERLRILYRIVHAIESVYGAATASAFLRSSNPQLDDSSPILLLRNGQPDEVEPPLLAATRAFLEG